MVKYCGNCGKRLTADCVGCTLEDRYGATPSKWEGNAAVSGRETGETGAAKRE